MTALSGPQRAALLRVAPAGAEPQARPRWTHRSTILALLSAGLIEEVSPGLYRRTPAGEAALAPQRESAA
jgi:hypothetical protein